MTHENYLDPLTVTSRSAAMHEVLRTVGLVSSSDLSVVILGEHGTGKEMVARTIHRLSMRANAPFVPFDCATMPADEAEKELFGFESVTHDTVVLRRGAMEEASPGTILLNEFGALSTSTQKKIARVIESGDMSRVGGDRRIPVNVRIIATQTEHSESSLNRGSIQKDLFYRISPIVLDIPALRERREDIPFLVEKFLSDLREQDHVQRSKSLSSAALKILSTFHWPGNVVQLKNAVEYAAIMSVGEIILPEHLPAFLQSSGSRRKKATTNSGRNILSVSDQ